jgi:hypothetical protein
MTIEGKQLRENDAEFAIRFTRVTLHLWPTFTGIFALAVGAQSTESALLVSYGIPWWALGALLIASGLLLLWGRITRWWPPLALGDFIVGTECLIMAIIMGITAFDGHSSGLSVGLWLFPGVLFELHSVLRVRWR